MPYFTLYGDGTVVFVQASTSAEPSDDGIGRGSPLRTGKLTEPQVQDLLEFALADGGLAIARADYQNPLVADAPTAIFEINADGATKTVSVVALGMDDPQPGPDTAIKTSLAKLGERLRDFDRGGTLSSAAYAPAAYRAVLTDASGGAGAAGPRRGPGRRSRSTDFTFPADPSALRQGTRGDDAGRAGRARVDGARERRSSPGSTSPRPDGKLYSLVIRPLLPDETRR